MGQHATVSKPLCAVHCPRPVQVVAEALRCCASLAKGLRRDYSGCARSLVDLLLDKFKDKAAAVRGATLEALSAMHMQVLRGRGGVLAGQERVS